MSAELGQGPSKPKEPLQEAPCKHPKLKAPGGSGSEGDFLVQGSWGCWW